MLVRIGEPPGGEPAPTCRAIHGCGSFRINHARAGQLVQAPLGGRDHPAGHALP